MTSPTIRIRLAHQPPLYFVAAVVVASLLPLLFQFMPDASSAVALQRLPTLVASTLPLQRIEMPALAVLDDEQIEVAAADEPEEVVIVEVDEPEKKAKPRAMDRSREPEPTRKVLTAKPGLEQRGKAACAARNKTAARDAFRALPLGDDRRRTIRRACRDAGILIL